MVKWMKEKFCKLHNPFYIHTPHLDRFVKDIEGIQKDVKSVQEALRSEKELLQNQLKEKEVMLESLLEALPDMAWFKDLEGNYVYANKAIKDGLLCTDNPIGKNDVELALNNKKKYGEENHTFGEKCSNSDLLVIEKQAPQRFVENGKVRGKHLELEVYKNVVRDKETGEILGTVGTGRDITEYVMAIEDNRKCASKCSLVDVFKKNRFGD